MNRIIILTLVTTLCSARTAAHSPNLLFILTDQHRQDGVGGYGKSKVKTPNLDALARDGVRFDRAYVAQPVCSPNRASILTGLYPHAHGVTENNVPLAPKMVTLAERLAARGYDCGYFGKWHLGRDNAQGFATFPDYPNDGRGSKHYFPTADGGKRYGVEVLTEDAIAFIRRPREGAFFVMVSFYPPHPPYSVPEKYEEMYRDDYPEDRARRIYYAMCSKVDEEVGRLLSAVAEGGSDKNTLVVFTTEHGHNFERRWNDHQKRLCYDTSSLIPLLMRLPGMIPAKRTCRDLISSVDLTPTILALLGQEVPEGLHGVDLSSLARGVTGRRRDAVFLVNLPYVRDAKRGQERCVRGDRFKLILSTVRPPELYDMHADPTEEDNLWPVRSGSTEVKILEKKLSRWAVETGDQLARELLSSPRNAPTRQ